MSVWYPAAQKPKILAKIVLLAPSVVWSLSCEIACAKVNCRSFQVGDDVPHAVVGEKEEFAARLREVVDAVAGVQNLQREEHVVT